MDTFRSCADIVPGSVIDQLLHEGLDIKSRTYAACARAIIEDNPEAAAPESPRQPPQLPPNCQDVTAERVGTATVIVGGAAAG